MAAPEKIFCQAFADSVLQVGSLKNCIQYALTHQTSVKQSLLDEEITDREIKSKLADWYPQLNLNFSFQHNSELPTSIIQGNPVKFGLNNTSSAQFSISQTIFNRDVLLASSTSDEVRKRSQELTIKNKIDVVVGVSKAFYSVLLTNAQIKLLDEDILRLQKSLNDAYSQYKSGIVDKIDYKRASIALNNATAEQKQNAELLKSREAYLKEVMGYPASANLKLMYDTTRMENETAADTNQAVNFSNRIEYQIFETQKQLLESNLHYYEWSFIPSLTAFGYYNFNYMNNDFQKLYERNYPSSYLGLQLSLPIFEGGKRLQEISRAKLELERAEYDLTALRNSLNTEFVQALSDYKSNLNTYRVMKENLALARDVFSTVELQYKSGIKTYLEVITAETDLRTTEFNFFDSLYRVLSSKLDLQKALGEIKY